MSRHDVTVTITPETKPKHYPAPIRILTDGRADGKGRRFQLFRKNAKGCPQSVKLERVTAEDCVDLVLNGYKVEGDFPHPNKGKPRPTKAAAAETTNEKE